jgi:phage terminase Nu1 subunit (DNA packaging protein)
MCAILGWTRQIFDAHVRDGMPLIEAPSERTGEYKVYTGDVVRWLVQRAVIEASGGDDEDGGPLDPDKELALLRREQRKAKKMENETSLGNLIPAHEVVEEMQARIGRCRSLILGLPAAIADELALMQEPAIIRRRLYDALSGLLNELARERKEEEED